MNQKEKNFPWYEVVSGIEIGQGDFFNNFPILIQPLDMGTTFEEIENQEIIPSVDFYNVIVMTQSCDFQKMLDNDLVTLCPTSNFRDLYGTEQAKGKSRWKPLIEGRIVGTHLLNKCEILQHEFDYQVVDLTRLFSVPLGYVKKFANNVGKRIRLMPPYCEHLAQAFAKRCMRVGLPIDLPREFPYK